MPCALRNQANQTLPLCVSELIPFMFYMLLMIMVLEWIKRTKSQAIRYRVRYKTNRQNPLRSMLTLLLTPRVFRRVHRCPLQRDASVVRGGCAGPGFESPWGRHRSVESGGNRQNDDFAHTFAHRCSKVHGCPRRTGTNHGPSTHSCPVSPRVSDKSGPRLRRRCPPLITPQAVQGHIFGILSPVLPCWADIGGWVSA